MTEKIGIIASIIAIVAGLFGAGIQFGKMQTELEARGESIKVLHADIRELRDGWARHLELHLNAKGVEK